MSSKQSLVARILILRLLAAWMVIGVDTGDRVFMFCELQIPRIQYEENNTQAPLWVPWDRV